MSEAFVSTGGVFPLSMGQGGWRHSILPTTESYTGVDKYNASTSPETMGVSAKQRAVGTSVRD